MRRHASPAPPSRPHGPPPHIGTTPNRTNGNAHARAMATISPRAPSSTRASYHNSADDHGINNSDPCQRYNEPTSSAPSPRTDQSLPPQASQALAHSNGVLSDHVRYPRSFDIDGEVTSALRPRTAPTPPRAEQTSPRPSFDEPGKRSRNDRRNKRLGGHKFESRSPAGLLVIGYPRKQTAPNTHLVQRSLSMNGEAIY